MLNAFYEGVIVIVCINIIAVLGMSVLTGFTRLFSFGNAGFMSIGAYGAAICSVQLKLPFPISILIGALAAGSVAFLLGSLTIRLRGDYFLISCLPYGHQRKLEIARAMATKPKLLLLDEPAAGMNADESIELVEFIRRLKELYPVTILMIEHHMDVVTNLCEQCTVLNFGKTLSTGRMEDIRRNPEVIEAYLGGDE